MLPLQRRLACLRQRQNPCMQLAGINEVPSCRFSKGWALLKRTLGLKAVGDSEVTVSCTGHVRTAATLVLFKASAFGLHY